MKPKVLFYLTISALFLIFMHRAVSADACTSMIVGAEFTASGRPMLWKHRDTGTPHNFVERVDPVDGYSYVGLFNGGDSLLSEAWAGFNEAGFAIMNTASYNLAPDTARIKDREAVVMSLALKRCRTVADFAALLDSMPRPMGVQANFGVLDATGDGAYFETNDYGYTRFDLHAQKGESGENGEFFDVPGLLTRTNFSFSGNDTDGFGYIRYRNALDILADDIANRSLTPESLTEGASRSFWHSLLKHDFAAPGHPRYVVDQDFIPRRITSASVVIEVAPKVVGERREDCDRTQPTTMWVMIGYTPCSYVVPVTLDSIPAELRPLEPGFRSRLCNEVVDRKQHAFPIVRGSGKSYIDMNYIDSISPALRAKSTENYRNFRSQFNH